MFPQHWAPRRRGRRGTGRCRTRAIHRTAPHETVRNIPESDHAAKAWRAIRFPQAFTVNPLYMLRTTNIFIRPREWCKNLCIIQVSPAGTGLAQQQASPARARADGGRLTAPLQYRTVNTHEHTVPLSTLANQALFREVFWVPPYSSLSSSLGNHLSNAWCLVSQSFPSSPLPYQVYKGSSLPEEGVRASAYVERIS